VFSSLKEKPNILLVGIAINTANMTAKQIREAKKKLESESYYYWIRYKILLTADHTNTSLIFTDSIRDDSCFIRVIRG
jgi:hypothetical protein